MLPASDDSRHHDTLASVARESGRLWTAAIELLSAPSPDVDEIRRMTAALAAQAETARNAGLQISHNELQSARRRLLTRLKSQAEKSPRAH